MFSMLTGSPLARAITPRTVWLMTGDRSAATSRSVSDPAVSSEKRQGGLTPLSLLGGEIRGNRSVGRRRPMTMQRISNPRPVLALLAVGALALAACGDDSTDDAGSDTGSTLPPVTEPNGDANGDANGDGYERPTGADEVVLEYSEVGGFTTREFAFQRTPNLLVSGGNEAFRPGAQIAIFPGPLLPAVQVQDITDEGIQNLLAAADDAGLLADVEYEEPTNIADATTARLVINVDGETFVHEAYALGLSGPGGADGESTPERQALADFVFGLGDLAAVVGAENLATDAELIEPDEFAIEALPVDDRDAYTRDGIEPSVVPWPADAGVALTDATTCTVIPAEGVADVFASANQLTFFDDGGTVYQVLVRPVLPGGGCA